MTASLLFVAFLAPNLPPQGVPYDCPVAPPIVDATCAASAKWIGELVAAQHHISTTQGPFHQPPPGSYCAWAAGLVTQGLEADPAGLTVIERVVAQHAALGLALGGACDGEKAPRAAAAKLAARLAVDPPTLKGLGTVPFADIDAWIGPRTGWKEMKGNVPLQHDQLEGFRTAFRPVRAGSTRAVFGQIVAFDTKWQPQVTPVVSRIEIRRGTDHQSPACVVKLDPKRLRCAAQRMHPMHIADTPSHRFGRGFLRRSAVAGRMGCDTCHGPGSVRAGVSSSHVFFGDLQPVPSGEREAHLAARRKALLEGAVKSAQSVRDLLKP